MRKSLIFDALSAILFICGLTALLLSPRFWAHTTYISENALLPGSASIQFSSPQYEVGKSITQKWIEQKKQNAVSSSDWIVQQLESLGLEAHKQQYSIINPHNVTNGWNVYSIIRAPKGVGTEAVVIAARYNKRGDLSATENSISGLGLGVALMKHFQNQKWAAKDIIFVASDDENGGQVGLKQWLNAYYGKDALQGLKPRGGNIQAALNIDIQPLSQFDQLVISTEGANGKLPNLDLVNTVMRICRREGMKEDSILLSPLPTWLSQFLNPFKESSENYLSPEVKTLLTFMANQAAGVPTGDHGVFNMYHIDAITLTNQVKTSGNRPQIPMANFGRIIEGTVRSLNNLIERLHQSFYYYLLPAPNRYISIGEYMIPLGLLLAGFALKIVLVIISLKHDSQTAFSFSLFGIFQFLGCLVFALPYIIDRINHQYVLHLSWENITLYWLVGSALIVTTTFTIVIPKARRLLRGKPFNPRTFRALASLCVVIFLGVGSLLNFSFCFFAAIYMIPLYTILSPTKNFFLKWIQLLILFAHSPLAQVVLFSLASSQDPLHLLAVLLEQFRSFGNLTFPFLCLAHFPINLAYLYIFLAQ